MEKPVKRGAKNLPSFLQLGGPFKNLEQALNVYPKIRGVGKGVIPTPFETKRTFCLFEQLGPGKFIKKIFINLTKEAITNQCNKDLFIFMGLIMIKV
jgi:hypothetical protein